jgi:hypothetical protein
MLLHRVMATTRFPEAVYPVLPARRDMGPRTDPELARAHRMARVLDHYLVDPVIGLVLPGIGDVIGSLLGLYTVAIALKRKISPVVIARMLLNLGLDTLVGIVPLFGDLADVGFKANKRNVALLQSRAAHGGKATWRDWLMVIGAALVFIAAIGLTIYFVGALVGALRSLF